MSTYTLREALAKKKLLDKQIQDIYSTTAFITIASADCPMINGMTFKDYEEFAKAKWQSLNDKIAFRDKLANAILQANVENRIMVPKFTSLDTLADDSKEQEEISFASAIARKEYYQNCLAGLCNNIISVVNSAHITYVKRNKEKDVRIQNQLNTEFGTTTNASSKQRQERQEDLEKKYEVLYIDPVKLCSKAGDMKLAIEDYLCKIDALLGHATDTTNIEIED